MANLKDLIVQGSSRFLSDVTANDVTVEGDLTIEGTTTLSGDPTQDNEAATKHYVDDKISGLPSPPSPADAAPLMDGTAAVGTSTDYAREDHVHPTDTSRAPLASPAFTGNPTAPTQSAGNNSTRLATTAFVTTAIGNAKSNWTQESSTNPSYIQNRPDIRTGGGNNSLKLNDISINGASGDYSIAEGKSTSAYGEASHAEGMGANGARFNVEVWSQVTPVDSFTSFNFNGHVGDTFEFDEGQKPITRTVSSITFGINGNPDTIIFTPTLKTIPSYTSGTITSGSFTTSGAYGDASHAEGSGTTAFGEASHAEGKSTVTYVTEETGGDYDSGYDYLALGTAPVIDLIEGDKLTFAGDNTLYTVTKYTSGDTRIYIEPTPSSTMHSVHITLYHFTSGAIGDNSHTEGLETVAYNDNEHAEGKYNLSYASDSYHSDRKTIHTIGIGSDEEHRQNAVQVMENGDVFVMGVGTFHGDDYRTSSNLAAVISDISSAASTQANWTQTNTSHAGYIQNKPYIKAATTSLSSIVEGNTAQNTVASGVSYAHAEGTYTQVTNTSEHAEGRYNLSHTTLEADDSAKTQHSVGIGDSNTRKNAFEIMQNGDAYLDGVGGYDGTNPNGTGVKTLQESISKPEVEMVDTTNNLADYRGMLAKRKVYTGVLGVANGSAPNNNTHANRSVYFITLHPNDFNSQWTIHYHINVHLDDETQQYKSSANASVVNIGQLCRGTYDCMLSGTASVYNVYHMFQSQKNTSYRPIYYHIFHGPTSAGANNGEGYKIGVNLHNSYLPVPTNNYTSGSAVLTSYTRTIEVVIDECVNCTAELNETLEVEADAYRSDYTKLNSTYYTTATSDSNTAGRYALLSATTQGLYETGDDNIITYTQQSNNYMKNGTTFSDDSAGYFLGYNLLGFDKDGNALAISKRTPTATSYDASVQTTRVYCNKGFDYTKGIRYYASTGNFAAGADMNISTHLNYSGLDFRYSDNCVASGTANLLGLISREPVYLRGTIKSDGLFYLSPIEVTYNNNTYKRAWVQPGDATRLSTSPFDTDHVYWFIGYPYYNSTYAASLYVLNLASFGGIDYYDGTQMRPYAGGIRDYLPLAGGTMTGDITMSSGSDINFASGSGMSFGTTTPGTCTVSGTDLHFSGTSIDMDGSKITGVGNATTTGDVLTYGQALRYNSSTTTYDADAKRITNLATPTNASDAVTKTYVDTAVSGASQPTYTTTEPHIDAIDGSKDINIAYMAYNDGHEPYLDFSTYMSVGTICHILLYRSETSGGAGTYNSNPGEFLIPDDISVGGQAQNSSNHVWINGEHVNGGTISGSGNSHPFKTPVDGGVREISVFFTQIGTQYRTYIKVDSDTFTL